MPRRSAADVSWTDHALNERGSDTIAAADHGLVGECAGVSPDSTNKDIGLHSGR